MSLAGDLRRRVAEYLLRRRVPVRDLAVLIEDDDRVLRARAHLPEFLLAVPQALPLLEQLPFRGKQLRRSFVQGLAQFIDFERLRTDGNLRSLACIELLGKSGKSADRPDGGAQNQDDQERAADDPGQGQEKGVSPGSGLRLAYGRQAEVGFEPAQNVSCLDRLPDDQSVVLGGDHRRSAWWGGEARHARPCPCLSIGAALDIPDESAVRFGDLEPKDIGQFCRLEEKGFQLGIILDQQMAGRAFGEVPDHDRRIQAHGRQEAGGLIPGGHPALGYAGHQQNTRHDQDDAGIQPARQQRHITVPNW